MRVCVSCVCQRNLLDRRAERCHFKSGQTYVGAQNAKHTTGTLKKEELKEPG